MNWKNLFLFKKAAFLIIGILILFYLSIPWIAEPFIRSQLPAEAEISHLELGYPTFSGIKIHLVKARFNDIEATLENLSADYALSRMRIESIGVNLLSKVESTDTALSIPPIPVFDPQESLNILKSKSFTIDKLTINKEKVIYSFEDLEVISTEDNNLNVKVSFINFNDSYQTNDVSVQFTSEKNKLVFVLQGPHFSANGTYGLDAESTEIGISVGGLDIQQYLPKELDKNIKINEPIKFSIKQNYKKLTGRKSHTKSSVKAEMFATTKFANIVETHLDIALTSKIESEQSYLEVKTQLESFDKNSERNLLSEINFNIKQNKLNEYKIESLYLLADVKNIALPSEAKLVTLKSATIKSEPLTFSTDDLLNQDTELSFRINNLDFSVEKQDKGVIFSAQSTAQGKLSNFKKIYLDSNSHINKLNLENLTPSENLNFNLSLENFDLTKKSGAFKSTLSDDAGEIKDISYQSFKIDMNGTVINDTANTSGVALINNKLSVPFEAEFNLKKSTGVINLIKNENKISHANAIIRQFTKSVFKESAFKSGKLSHSGKLEITDGVNGEIDIALVDANFSFDESLLNNIDAKAKVKILESRPKIKAETSINKVDLSSGLEVSDIRFSLESQNDNRKIKNISAKLMEGILTSDALDTQGNEIQPSLISLSNLSLFELISFLNMESLFADGLIDMQIPIESKNGGVVVKNGTFKSVKKGVIKYNSGEDLSQSENLALKALQNFQYSQLDGIINYNSDGDYTIKLHLLGANPDLYSGHPVDFTFNIKGNLPGLFKSLFLSGNFEQSILDSISKDALKKLQ